MPGFNGTGPRGMGPLSGGGRGYCSPYGMRIAPRPFISRGRPGFGYGYTYAPGLTPTREQEIDFLRNEAQALKKNLEEIDARIKELSGEGK